MRTLHKKMQKEVTKEDLEMPKEATKGNPIIEGKTKTVYELIEGNVLNDDLALVENKDKITAFDGARSHDLEGKAVISNITNAKVFKFLNNAGFPTSFLRLHDDRSFIANRCQMIPLEWVTRRIATGSFIRRNPGVKEGYKFNPPKLETFFKDDKNNDPQWSEEQILEAKLEIGGVKIKKYEYDYMAKMTVAVFEVLERAWASADCALIDMKIEFGIDSKSEILISDVIDSDSWRLWPSGDKRLMKDKQVYRNLQTVTEEALTEVKRNFEWVATKLDAFIHDSNAMVVIIMGSASDKSHSKEIRDHCLRLGINACIRVSSAHKTTKDTLDIVAEFEGANIPIVFIAVAGRSNGLGPVLSGNASFPVINCPPLSHQDVEKDIWSSLRTPSGLGCCTVLYPEAAAQHAAQIFAMNDHILWARLKAKQLKLWRTLKIADRELQVI